MPRLSRIIKRVSTGLLALALLGSLASAALAQEPEIYRGEPGKSTTGAVFRSLALPGWGQVYTENYWKAAAFFVAETAIMASMSWQQDRTQAARRSADNACTGARTDTSAAQQAVYQSAEFVHRRNEYFYRDNRNELVWWLAGTILLAMGDSYVNAHMYGVDWSPELSLERGTVGVTVSCKF